MKFLHYKVEATAGSTVRVVLSGSECNVMIMDDLNFYQYRRGGSFRYVGGHYRRSPVFLTVPETGTWNVVVDTGGYSGRVQAAVAVI